MPVKLGFVELLVLVFASGSAISICLCACLFLLLVSRIRRIERRLDERDKR
jgi:uncharacterized membrane protein YciS (DUF1049 family)